MDKIIKKLFCWVFGHNYHISEKAMYCVRCGVSQPKPAEEMQPLSYFIGDVRIDEE
ncbi:MAG: hypothetical protein II304_02655 [Bacteroidales bacterium]|nr:hypothetical protein [Bacteroidales bacterium]